MNPLKRYPFKSMLAIVKALSSSNEPKAVMDLMRYSRACYPDTTEVSNFLAYITSFGQVHQEHGKWSRTGEIDEKPSKPRRYHFISDIMKVIFALNEQKKSVQEISEETGMEPQLVESYLRFLEGITKYGIVRIKKGKVFTSFYISPPEILQ